MNTQIYYSYSGKVLYRQKQFYLGDTWSEWKQLSPDYNNLLMNSSGYIVFTNGLIIQWMQKNINGIDINNGYNMLFPIIFNNLFSAISGSICNGVGYKGTCFTWWGKDLLKIGGDATEFVTLIAIGN